VAVSAGQLRQWIGSCPFRWNPNWSRQPPGKYHGFMKHIHRKNSRAIMAYIHNQRMAYHNWYGGRIFGEKVKTDRMEIKWLHSETAGFVMNH
jgi:hypothetical protein